MNKVSNQLSTPFIEKVCARMAANKRVRRTLPCGGRLHMDRPLPFIVIYRGLKPGGRANESLVTGEAAYLIACEGRGQHRQLSLLVRRLAEMLTGKFGSFLIIEVWFDETTGACSAEVAVAPAFKLLVPPRSALSTTAGALKKQLQRIVIRKKRAVVDATQSSRVAPPGLSPLFTPAEMRRMGCHMLGLEVKPIHRDMTNGQSFPLVRRELHRGLSRALKHCFFAFTHAHTTQEPQHYQALGRWSVVKAVWDVDRRLAAICEDYDFLLQVTPTNTNAAWRKFQRSKCSSAPSFAYRPLAVDPYRAKRELLQVPVERIEDPTLAQLFRDQQLELDRKFTMLLDLGSSRFRYGGLQLYGSVDCSLMQLATDLLAKLPSRAREGRGGSMVDAQAFAARAEQELDLFRMSFADLQNKIMVCEDISGLMVSHGNLLVGAKTMIPKARVEALIQHEVGTHVLTYLNGKAQPFQQLHIGLPGYEELQEGLAVLAEYLVGGLTQSRLRLLAARVVAVRHMIDDATFPEVFHVLNQEHGIERQTAFGIAVRTFRGGGLTKDAMYLRGFVKLLDYLKKGHALEPLYAGKISAAQVPIIQELHWRKVLRDVPLYPTFLKNPQAVQRLKVLRTGTDIYDLL